MTDILLGVNIDHIATVREARGTTYPSPIQAALLAEQAGADGITLHLREDRRHIQDEDVVLLKECLQTRMNLEMAITDEMVEVAEMVEPHAVCLVPEKREELTTEGGLDVVKHFESFKPKISRLLDKGIEVSLFIDPDSKQIEAAKELGVPVVEIHTGEYAENPTEENLSILQQAAKEAHSMGLQVNAGHGLHYHNVQAVAKIPELVELNIGHAIIARALFTGIEKAVSEMKRLMVEARAQ